MSDNPLFAGVELGGTKAIALLARGSEILDRHTVATTDPVETLVALRDWLFARSGDFAALGIASFGPVRIEPSASDFGHILATPKPGWAGADVVGAFAGLGVPILIDTDVNAAALAEHRWGAAQGASAVTYVTIGTGVGGGTLIDGRTIKGRLHPEVGHLLLKRAGGDVFAGACGFHGDCLEGLICGPALAARFGEPPASVSSDDPRWENPAHDLAVLLVALISSYAPQRMLVGGGVTLGAPWLLEMAIDRMPDLMGGYFPDLNRSALGKLISTPALGNNAGPLGAIALAQDALRQRG